MKKILVCLAVLCVALAGALAGLSVLPHSHGSDLDHSQHKNCPVHQFGSGHVDATFASSPVLLVLFVLLWRVFIEPRALSAGRYFPTSDRAPPTTS